MEHLELFRWLFDHPEGRVVWVGGRKGASRALYEEIRKSLQGDPFLTGPVELQERCRANDGLESTRASRVPRHGSANPAG